MPCGHGAFQGPWGLPLELCSVGPGSPRGPGEYHCLCKPRGGPEVVRVTPAMPPGLHRREPWWCASWWSRVPQWAGGQGWTRTWPPPAVTWTLPGEVGEGGRPAEHAARMLPSDLGPAPPQVPAGHGALTSLRSAARTCLWTWPNLGAMEALLKAECPPRVGW